MKNYYWCTNHPLEEGKTQVFCYHGYDTPYDCLISMPYIKALYEPAFLDYYLKNMYSLDDLKDEFGVSIMDMRGKYIVCRMGQVEGDEYIEKIALLPKEDQHNIPAINKVLSDLRKDVFIKTIDEIMADSENIVLSKQAEKTKIPQKVWDNRTHIQRMEETVWGLIDTVVAKARDSADSRKDIGKLRDMVSELVSYWGLDLNIIDQFDIEVDKVMSYEEEPNIDDFSDSQEYDDDWDSQDENDSNHRMRSSTESDYSPSHPWNAPGMSIGDFIR